MNKEEKANEYRADFKERRQLIQLIAGEMENISKCRLEIQVNRRVAVRETFAALDAVSSCFLADLRELLVLHGFEYSSWKEKYNKNSAEAIFRLRESKNNQTKELKPWDPWLVMKIEEGFNCLYEIRDEGLIGDSAITEEIRHIQQFSLKITLSLQQSLSGTD